MPTKVEKDAVTGTETTGHEWDGIKELNTPLPKWWLYVMYATIVFSVVYWLLYPSWPLVSTYLPGLLGYDQREALDEQLAEVEAERAVWLDRVAEASLEEIAGDAELQVFAFAGGQAAFNDNCAPCHGLGGAGQANYPSLADDAWIWGGTLEAIHHTIRYGIRNDHPEARQSIMPQYGVTGILARDEIADVAHHVVSLSGEPEDAEAAARGAEIYAAQCAACHGEDGGGNPDLGAPNIADQIWLYGGSHAEITQQIWNPQHGVMPPWFNRLDPETVKNLAIYVHGLGGGV